LYAANKNNTSRTRCKMHHPKMQEGSEYRSSGIVLLVYNDMINLYHHSTRSIPRQRCKHHDTMDISYNESGHVAQLTNRRILCTSKSLVPTRCLYIAEPACPFCCCVLLLHGKQAGLALLEFHSILRPPYDTQDEHIVLQWILKCKSKVIRNTRKGVIP